MIVSHVKGRFVLIAFILCRKMENRGREMCYEELPLFGIVIA